MMQSGNLNRSYCCILCNRYECPHSMVNFGPLAADIGSVVWAPHLNVNGFRILAALLPAL